VVSAAQPIDTAWILFCTVLVLFMQAGFTCLETGLVRAKNSVNVAVKKIADVCIASLAFWLVGFGLMFGASSWGGIGLSRFAIGDPVNLTAATAWTYAFFVFQLTFCATATTIVSGAVAERMSFRGYVLTAAILSTLIYPVFGHWVWGGVINGGTDKGWLEALGFVDFAGASVVHSVGGWVSLAAVLVIGPRIGRFGPGGKQIEGHDMPTAVLGMFILWAGWLGFNGGSTYALNAKVPLVLVHTMLAAGAGGATIVAASWIRNELPDVGATLNGVLAGLVAITASSDMVTMSSAAIIGAVGGLASFGATALLERLEIDDAVGAVPVHLAGGVWGTLAVALFGDPSFFPQKLSRLEQFGVQSLGVAVAGVFAFGTAFVILSLVNRLMPLRVSPAAEHVGLNVSEHGASSALLDVLGAMEKQAARGDFSKTVPV
jgi:Amt family ammonium transporter